VRLEHIADRDLLARVREEIKAAAAAGTRHVRHQDGFERHLLGVAKRAEQVAQRLQLIVPAPEAPHPAIAFVSGAWHDAGKILIGDDYHEIASAYQILTKGAAWGFFRGSAVEAREAVWRTARAIIPHFAIYEQWQPGYQPSRGGDRRKVEPWFATLCRMPADATVSAEVTRSVMLPMKLDALVLIYADMLYVEGDSRLTPPFEETFQARWDEMAARVPQEDPALAALLQAVRSRIHGGCALVHRFITHGFDATALAAYRQSLPRLS
jgi:hypothetical protein